MSATDAQPPRYPGLHEFAAWNSGVHGYAATVVCAFGVVANMANIVVLTRRSMVTSTNLILTWLAVADLLTMACFLPFGGHFYIARGYVPEVSFPATRSAAWIRYFVFYINFSVVCHTVAVWLTITLAIFRYLCICYPTMGVTMCSLRRARVAVLIVYVASAVICLPNYLTIEIKKMPLDHNATTMYRQLNDTVHTESAATAHLLLSPTRVTAADDVIAIPADLVADDTSLSASSNASVEHEHDEYYTVSDTESVLVTINYWIQALFIKLLPCVLLTVLTVMLIVAMHEANVRRMKLKSQGRSDESERAREHNRTTAMLLAVVGLFQLVELPHGVLTLCSIFVPAFHTEVYWPLGDVIDMTALLNNSINFVLYCTMSRQFRNQFVETFVCCRCTTAFTGSLSGGGGSASGRRSTTSRSTMTTSAGWTKLRVLSVAVNGPSQKNGGCDDVVGDVPDGCGNGGGGRRGSDHRQEQTR